MIFERIKVTIRVKKRVTFEQKSSSKHNEICAKRVISKIVKNLFTLLVSTKPLSSFLFHKIKLTKYKTKKYISKYGLGIIKNRTIGEIKNVKYDKIIYFYCCFFSYFLSYL